MTAEWLTTLNQIWTYAAYALILALLVVSCLNINWPTKAKLILAGCWLLGGISASYGVLAMAAAHLLLHRPGGFSDAVIFWLMAAILVVIPTLKFRRYRQYYLKHDSSCELLKTLNPTRFGDHDAT